MDGILLTILGDPGKLILPEPAINDSEKSVLVYLAWKGSASAIDLLNAGIDSEGLTSYGGAHLFQKNNPNQVQRWISNLREVLPGKFSIPRANRSRYTLVGPRTCVDYHFMKDCRDKAESALANDEYSLARDIAERGLTAWKGPLSEDYARKKALAALYGESEGLYADLCASLSDALVGLGLATLAVQHLNRCSQAFSFLAKKDKFSAALQKAQPTRTTAPKAGGDSQRERTSTASIITSVFPEGSPTRMDFGLNRALNRSQSALEDILQNTQPVPGFHFFTVSGVSAAGKDTLVRRVSQLSEDDPKAQFMVMPKYSTRRPRVFEDMYANFLSTSDFMNMLEAGELVFPYVKRNEWYAFLADHMRQAISGGSKLLAIYTEFRQVPIVRTTLRQYGLPMTSVLIRCDADSAFERTASRGFDSEEKSSRLLSIQQDLNAMANQPNLEQEYMIVDHTNDHAQNPAVEALLSIIRNARDNSEYSQEDSSDARN